MRRGIGLIVLVALAVGGCGGTTATAPAGNAAAGASASAGASAGSPAASNPRSAASTSAEPGSAWTGTATAVRTAIESAGYACANAADVAGFQIVMCPKTGTAEIDLYARAGGSVAGLEVYGAGTPMTADEVLSALGPALDAATSGWSDIGAAVRAAGSPQTVTTTVLPGSGLSLLVRGYPGSNGLASVALLAPDLAEVWGHVPARSPAAS